MKPRVKPFKLIYQHGIFMCAQNLPRQSRPAALAADDKD
jgi:hypothetical protein